MGIMANGHFHTPSGYTLKKGDMFRFDGGSIFQKYHSDAGGCAVIGTPTQKQKDCYRGIQAGMERALELLRPGALPSKIFQEVVSAVEKAGLKDYSRLAEFCGHGSGRITQKTMKAIADYSMAARSGILSPRPVESLAGNARI